MTGRLLTAAAFSPAVAAMVAMAAARAAEAARPIAVMDRTDIEMPGLTNVRELVLSRAVYNSFGLHRPLVLGTGRGEVLVDERRLSDSTLDFDTLPVLTVERIEVLDEGAGRFGGQAIAGAVNIVLRRGYRGAEVSGSLARLREAGGVPAMPAPSGARKGTAA